MNAIWSHHNDTPPVIGAVAYLIERDVLPGASINEVIGIIARDEPGRTNRSGEIRLRGWLGTTNNVCEQALGVYIITQIVQHNDASDSTTVRLRKVRPSEIPAQFR